MRMKALSKQCTCSKGFPRKALRQLSQSRIQRPHDKQTPYTGGGVAGHTPGLKRRRAAPSRGLAFVSLGYHIDQTWGWDA